MRYTFNMVTMLKEKVNTHFSFPTLLNMEQYMEKNLMPEVKQSKFLSETFIYIKSVSKYVGSRKK